MYDVKPENGNGKTRTLHRNILLPCGYLAFEKTPDVIKRTSKYRRKRSSVVKKDNNSHERSDVSEDEASFTPNQLRVPTETAHDEDQNNTEYITGSVEQETVREPQEPNED